MDPIPSSAPTWKTRAFPGLVGGLLLTLIQLGIVLLGSDTSSGLTRLGFPFLPHWTPVIVFLLWLFYLVIPAFLARLVTSWTRQPSLGYRAGRLAGVLCAVILILATLTYPQPTLDPAPGSRSLIAGYPAAYLTISRDVLSVLYHVVGILLAMLSAFLSSRKWRRVSAPEKQG